VIAAVEIYAQVQTLKREAAARGVALQVEKLDVTSEGDRKKALAWNIEILVNNAGVLEGGSVLDIPRVNMRHEFEVNMIGPLMLTQGIAKQMVKRGKGRIVWVSSREGLNVNPFTGIYSASKHAVEAVAETMSLELQEFGIEVGTINPGPFLSEEKLSEFRASDKPPASKACDPVVTLYAQCRQHRGSRVCNVDDISSAGGNIPSRDVPASGLGFRREFLNGEVNLLYPLLCGRRNLHVQGLDLLHGDLCLLRV
jgi:NAD(P)-dependent dehydrogenase (short-subunit alcohol dehydrogenase family)